MVQLPLPSHWVPPIVHGVPSGAFGFEHTPVNGSQVPARWH